MSYLIDTDWVIDYLYLAGRKRAVELLAGLPPGQLSISIVTYGEVYDGIYHGRDPIGAEQSFVGMLRQVGMRSLDQGTMRLFGRIRGDLEAIGQRLSDTDLMIAATAIHEDLVLVTRNVKHYARVPDLRLFSESSV